MLQKLRKIITTLGLSKEIEEDRYMKSLLVPITTVAPLDLYDAIIEKSENNFEKKVYIKLGASDKYTAFRACNFVVPRKFHVKSGILEKGMTVEGLVEGKDETKKLVIRSIKKAPNRTVFITPEVDAYYI